MLVTPIAAILTPEIITLEIIGILPTIAAPNGIPMPETSTPGIPTPKTLILPGTPTLEMLATPIPPQRPAIPIHGRLVHLTRKPVIATAEADRNLIPAIPSTRMTGSQNLLLAEAIADMIRTMGRRDMIRATVIQGLALVA
jgi:hypothetical protein